MIIEANISSVAAKDTGDALVTQAKDRTAKDKLNKKFEKRSCFHCKKPGHLKRDCRKWKAEQAKEQEKSTASIASGQAFVTAGEESDKVLQNKWLIQEQYIIWLFDEIDYTILKQLRKDNLALLLVIIKLSMHLDEGTLM